MGECGIRGGYMELVNFDNYAFQMAVKFQSINLCSNTMGQIMMDLKINPPSLSMESEETIHNYETEQTNLITSLKRRADACAELCNQMDNVSLATPPEGAMYAFPQLFLPDKFVKKAEEQGVAPDFLYCQKGNFLIF